MCCDTYSTLDSNHFDIGASKDPHSDSPTLRDIFRQFGQGISQVGQSSSHSDGCNRQLHPAPSSCGLAHRLIYGASKQQSRLSRGPTGLALTLRTASQPYWQEHKSDSFLPTRDEPILITPLIIMHPTNLPNLQPSQNPPILPSNQSSRNPSSTPQRLNHPSEANLIPPTPPGTRNPWDNTPHQHSSLENSPFLLAAANRAACCDLLCEKEGRSLLEHRLCVVNECNVISGQLLIIGLAPRQGSRDRPSRQLWF